MEIVSKFEPVFMTDLFVDLKDNDKTVIWFEVWLGNFPEKLKEKRREEYFIRVNKKENKGVDINVHNPAYWAGYNDQSVKKVDLQQSFSKVAPAIQHAKLLQNKWVQNKKRTAILLCKSDEFKNHLNSIIDFLNKYQE